METRDTRSHQARPDRTRAEKPRYNCMFESVKGENSRWKLIRSQLQQESRSLHRTPCQTVSQESSQLVRTLPRSDQGLGNGPSPEFTKG